MVVHFGAYFVVRRLTVAARRKVIKEMSHALVNSARFAAGGATLAPASASHHNRGRDL